MTIKCRSAKIIDYKRIPYSPRQISLQARVWKSLSCSRHTTSIIVKCKHQPHFLQPLSLENWYKMIAVMNHRKASKSCSLLRSTVKLENGILRNGNNISEKLELKIKIGARTLE